MHCNSTYAPHALGFYLCRGSFYISVPARLVLHVWSSPNITTTEKNTMHSPFNCLLYSNSVRIHLHAKYHLISPINICCNTSLPLSLRSRYSAASINICSFSIAVILSNKQRLKNDKSGSETHEQQPFGPSRFFCSRKTHSGQFIQNISRIRQRGRCSDVGLVDVWENQKCAQRMGCKNKAKHAGFDQIE